MFSFKTVEILNYKFNNYANTEYRRKGSGSPDRLQLRTRFQL